ncbi:MAG: hypothetical protein KAY12_04310 [Arenimonas sp.]|nr:hypothetical protein [Arenimonas sp.]
MILRRLAEHLRHQHWTAIGIELAIVVLGVFIGMQVSNWNEERRDRALERQYLERLREDIASSMSGAQDGIEKMESQGRKATLMLESLSACRLDEAGQRADFASALYVLGRIEPPMLTRGTIDELRSTGRLGIIRSVRLRQALSNVVQEQERAMEVLGFIVARRSAQIGYVDARSTFLVTQDAGADKKRESDEVLFDFPALCKDPTYINAVSHLRQAAYVVVGQHRRLLVEYQAMLKLLDAELGKRSP